MDEDTIRVLMFEDNESYATLIESRLNNAEDKSFSTKHVTNLEEGFRKYKEDRFDVILLDLNLLDSKGLETYDRLVDKIPDVPVVILSATQSERLAVEAVRKGAQDYLTKGEDEPRRLSRCLRQAIERFEIQENLRAISMRDPVTQLYNRRGFLELGLQALKMSSRAENSCWLMAADLDNLKQINDTYGHPKGDFAIKKAGEILLQIFRESDIVARVGGDEFAVIANNVGEGGIEIIEERLQAKFKEINEHNKMPFKLSISTGFAKYDVKKHCVLEQLVKDADLKLYESKKTKLKG